MLLLGVSSAHAGWGWFGSGGSYGSYGGYGSMGGYASSWGSGGSYGGYRGWGSGGYTASWGSGGGYGSAGGWGSGGYASVGSAPRVGVLARLAARLRARHGSGGSYGSYTTYYASAGSYGSGGGYGSGGSYAGYATSSYSTGVSYGSGGAYGYTAAPTVSYSVPTNDCGCTDGCVGCGGATTIHESDVMSSDVIEAPVEDSGTVIDGNCATCTASTESRDSALLAIRVPDSAKVFVNGYETKSTGPYRQFVSSGLDAGKSYSYEVRAELDGQVATKLVSVQTGQRANLTFDFADPVSAVTETVLTLHVPEGAEVTLAGADTKQAGAKRVYSTKRLAPGETWDNYVVRVSLEKNGRKLTKERSISLEGGQHFEMHIDFNEDAIASR